MTQSDSNKEITLTTAELEVLIQAACSRAIAEHYNMQMRSQQVSQKIQAQLGTLSKPEDQDGAL